MNVHLLVLRQIVYCYFKDKNSSFLTNILRKIPKERILQIIDFSESGFFITSEIPDYIKFIENESVTSDAFSFKKPYSGSHYQEDSINQAKSFDNDTFSCLEGFNAESDFQKKVVVVLHILLDFIAKSGNHSLKKEDFSLQEEISKIKVPTKAYAFSNKIVSNTIVLAAKAFQNSSFYCEGASKLYCRESEIRSESMKKILRCIKMGDQFNPIVKFRMISIFIMIDLEKLAAWNCCIQYVEKEKERFNGE